MLTKVCELITYGVQKQIVLDRDIEYIYNKLCYQLNTQPTQTFKFNQTQRNINDILQDLTKHIDFSTKVEKELFKSKLVDCLLDKPSVIEHKFDLKYKDSPKEATKYYYELSKNTNYIKEKEIAKNINYKVESKYGQIDITINLSKPEKTPEEIKQLKNIDKQTYPQCLLCKEQEGYYGTLTNPDRSNHRMIQMKLNGKNFFFQYSPYSYFNEHAIILSKKHEDMHIDETAFSNLIEFVCKFEHYMIGSNADLPIVGGSMLTHDHYQAGRYEFPLFKADTKLIKDINNVQVHSVKWPLHTVKLVAKDKEKLLEIAVHVFNKWTNYFDEENKIYAKIKVRHSTITPIVRKCGGNFEMYLILRNNYQDDKHPSGLYHVAEKRHHIKKENIGLIEAMGLAVLPARLKDEIDELANVYLNKEVLPQKLSKHKVMLEALQEDKPINVKKYLDELVGQIFISGLEDCGVFKYNEEKYEIFIKEL